MFTAQLIQLLRRQINNNDDHTKKLDCFLEVVESEPTLRKSAHAVYQHPSQFNSVEDMMHNNPARDVFLPDIPGNNVAEYRFWICTKGLNPLSEIKDMLEAARLSQGRSSENLLSTPPSAQHGQRQLLPFESWKELRNEEDVAMLYDSLYGKRHLSRPDMIDRAALTDSSLENSSPKSNPLHPINTLNAFNLFRYQDRNNPICESQRSLHKYFPTNYKELCFPKPKNVLKMSPVSLSPEYIYNKYLPDFQKGLIVLDFCSSGRPKKRQGVMPDFISMPFTDRQGNESESEDAWESLFRTHAEIMPALAENLFKEGRGALDSLNPDSLLDRMERGRRSTMIVENVQNLTDLQRIRLLSQADLKVIATKREQSLDAFREAYIAHQIWVFEEFDTRVLREGSKVSAAAAAIINEVINTDLLDMSYSLPIFDAQLDVFGNMVANRMECYEQYLFVYAAHRQLLIFNMGQLDAFRHSYGLHFNSFSIGKSATSKSYLFELMERCSVSGTLQVITYQSLKADASDDNQNDLTMILNEFSLKSVNANESGARGNVTTPEAMMKEKTTSGRTSAKYLDRDEDGRRVTRVSINDCIGCWFGASNDDPSQVSESFSSRYHWAMFQLIERPDRSIVNLTDAEALLTGKSKQEINEFVDHMKRLQCLHWLVEKLIMTGGLSDVSLTCTNILVTHIDEYLQQHNIHVHSRTFTRIRIIARVLSIHVALHYLYFVPIKIVNAEGQWVDNFYKKPFDLDQLRSIDPYLCDEESISLFVIGLLRDQIVSPIEDIIRKSLRELHDGKTSRGDRYLYTGRQQQQQKQEASESDKAFEKLSHDLNSDKDDYGSGNSVPNREGAQPKPESDGSRNNLVPIYDYSYLNLRMKKEEVPEYIHSHYSSHSKPSLYQIKMCWKKICERSDYLHSYRVEPGKEKLFPVRDSSKEKEYGPLVKATDVCVWVHADLLNMSGRDKDIVKAAIESTYHRFTKSRKIVYGEPYDIKHPNLFKTITTRPNKRLLVTRNVLHMTAFSKKLLSAESTEDSSEESNSTKKKLRDIEFFYMDENLDTHTRRKRLLLLGISPTQHMIRAIHPAVIRQQLLISDKCKIDRTVSYPESYIKSKTERENRFHQMKQESLDTIKETMKYALASHMEADYVTETVPSLELPDELCAVDIDGADIIIEDADDDAEEDPNTDDTDMQDASDKNTAHPQNNTTEKKRKGVSIRGRKNKKQCTTVASDFHSMVGEMPCHSYIMTPS